MSKKFRSPSEMESEMRVPVSARVKEKTQKVLDREAKKNKLSLALLVANVLDDYVEWLEEQKKG